MKKNFNLKNIFKEGTFLIPLFFLGLSFGTDFFKFFLISLFLPIFVFYVFKKQGLHLKKIKLYTHERLISLFLLLLFFSSLLSDNIFSSFFGDFQNHLSSFFVIFFSFLFLVVFSRSGIINHEKSIKITLYSAYFLLVYKIISSFFPVIEYFYFNTEELLIIFSVVILFFTPLFYSEHLSSSDKKYLKIFLAIVFFLISLVLYKPLFILFLVAFSFQFYIFHKDQKKKVLSKKNILLVSLIFLFALFLSFGSENSFNIKDRNLDLRSSAKISGSSIKSDFLFGAGLGSYSEYFSLHRPADLNYSSDWQKRYKKSFSFFFDLIPETGTLATVSFLVFSVYILYILFSLVKKTHKDDYLLSSLMGASLFLILLPFISTFSYITLFVYCSFLAFFFSYLYRGEYLLLKPQVLNVKANFLQFVFFTLVFAWLFLFAYNVKYLIADSYSSNPDKDSLLKAVKYNDHFEEYYLSLSKIYLNNAKLELQKSNKDYSLIAQNIDNSKKMAEKALEINSKSVIPFESFGIIYRDFSNYANDGEELAIGALSSALALEPSNPVLATEIAKLYLALSQNDEALKYFNKALSLKSDYHEASLGVAQVMIRNNNNVEAIDLLESLLGKTGNNSQIYFEQGRALFNIGKNEQAIERFEKSILFDPQNSNSLYSLAIALEKKGDKLTALKYYKKVLDLNPTNIELIKKVKDLEQK
ncbi:hypothetical protein C0584_04650 [Candidatus Parcubacteria bacterium]|nr:MAG: hypothetical protein C0584_04650 [Candidatus Parcubacteria bacterium]